MNIFKEASESKKKGMGYRSRRFKILWQNPKVDWNHLSIDWGIRWSDKWQLFPVWNGSHNCQRALIFGFWKLHLSVIYYRSVSFNQNMKLPFNHGRIRQLYQLLF